MSERIEELRKRMTRTQFVRRKKNRRRNAASSGFEYRGSGMKVKITSKMRAARRRASVRLARLVKSASVQHKIGRTKKIRRGLYNSTDGVSRHSHSMIAAVVEFAQRTGNMKAAAAILEGTDPRITSTPIGMYGMDMAEKIGETPSISRVFVDFMVIDENTIGVCFEHAEDMTEGVLERELKPFGDVLTLYKPGDDVSEDEKSDLYMLAITVPENKLQDSVDEDVFEMDDNGDPLIDESKCLTDDQITALLNNPVFNEAASA